MKPSEVLRCAAETMRKRGKCEGRYFGSRAGLDGSVKDPGDGSPVCMLGAIVSAKGTTVDRLNFYPEWDCIQRSSTLMSMEDAVRFSDESTLEDVCTVLDEAAKLAEKEEGK